MNTVALEKHEGFAVVTLSWVLLSLFGTLPFVLGGSIPSFTDAYFETIAILGTVASRHNAADTVSH